MGRCGYLWTVGVRKSDKRQRDGGTERQRQGERAWKKCFELFDASRKERKRGRGVSLERWNEEETARTEHSLKYHAPSLVHYSQDTGWMMESRGFLNTCV